MCSKYVMSMCVCVSVFVRTIAPNKKEIQHTWQVANSPNKINIYLLIHIQQL